MERNGTEERSTVVLDNKMNMYLAYSAQTLQDLTTYRQEFYFYLRRAMSEMRKGIFYVLARRLSTDLTLHDIIYYFNFSSTIKYKIKRGQKKKSS